MSMHSTKRRALIARVLLGMFAIAITGGCAVGPDFVKPTAPAVKNYTAEPLPAQIGSTESGQSQTLAVGRDIPGQWWTLFHSAALNQLVEQALKSNFDLAAAQATLLQVRETVLAQEGTLLPAIDAKAGVSRQRTSSASFGGAGFGGSIYTLYNPAVTVSYTFGFSTQRELESLAAQEDYQRFQLEGAYLSLTANVVVAAVQEASLRAQIAATEKIVEAQTKQLNIMQRQLDLGAIAKADALLQQAQTAQTRAALPILQKQLAQKRDQLSVLTGQFPNTELEAKFELADFQLPSELPLTLPSALVEQRPDVRAQEAALHQANAQIGIATANLLPQFGITGSYGVVSNKANGLFSASNIIWSMGASALQPLFHGGQLRHARRAAIAAHDASAAQYRSVVLKAFADVADTLRALEFDAMALDAQKDAEQSAATSLELAQKQLHAGAINSLTLLNAERTYQQTHINYIQAQAGRYADTTALFQALGGGWWNRQDVTSGAATSHPN